MKVICTSEGPVEHYRKGEVYLVDSVTTNMSGEVLYYKIRNKSGELDMMPARRFMEIMTTATPVNEPKREKTLSEASYEELAKEMWKRCAETTSLI